MLNKAFLAAKYSSANGYPASELNSVLSPAAPQMMVASSGNN
jgi:hypothetical protein